MSFISTSLTPLLHDLRFQLRRDGPRKMAASWFQRLRGALRPGEEKLIVIVKDLDRIVQPAMETDLLLEDLEQHHLPALYELNRQRGFMRANRRFARYVELGYRGYVAFSEGQLVGYYWWVDDTATTPYPDLENLGLGVELNDGDVYGSDFFMLEAHRGGGRASDLLFKLETDLRSRGYRKLWGYVVSGNRPARWLYSSRGYEPMWTVLRRTGLFRRGGETASRSSQTEASA